jgi:hypothetical protein
MTTHKATGTRLFISADPLPGNPTHEDFERLEWKEVGNIFKPNIIREISNTIPVFRDFIHPTQAGSQISSAFNPAPPIVTVKQLSERMPIKPIY